MMKLSRFGAAALAIALSVTFVNPTVALAKTERTAQLNYAGDFSDDSEIIDEDVVSLGNIVGTGTDEAEADDDAWKKALEAAAAKGLVTTTKPSEKVSPDPESKTIDGKTYYYEEGGIKNSNWINDDDGVTYTATLVNVRGTIYKNRITGKTSIFKNEVDSNFTEDEATARQFQKAIRIKAGETTYLGIKLIGGDTKISGIKSSKKAVATAKLYSKMSTETNTNEDLANIEPIYDQSTGKYTYTVSYYTTVGAKVVVGTYDNYDKALEARKSVKGDASSAYRYIALNSKKKGKTNLSFNIINKNGTSTKVSTTVYAVDDTSVFKTFSYAGLSLLGDYSNSKNINYNKKEEDGWLWNTTTKKSGKLVIKPNANYQIKKVEIGVLYDESWSEGISGTDRDGDKYDNSDYFS
ncbi:MAG: hypothetical protein K6G06_08130, partial [Butyrivibrio sp.]|nr:hypothetical protein [Butyrivibrio sp.]